jgi:hypothetical protein
LASTNGVFLNGQRLTGPKLLRPGDMLGLGETVVLEVAVVRDPESTVVKSLLPAPELPADPVVSSGPAFPVNPAPALADSFPSAPAPAEGKPAWQQDRRVWVIGGVCGCLTLCGCGAATFLSIYVALNPGFLQALGIG